MTPILLSPDQAAAMIGVGTRTLANWRVSGRGPTFCRRGRSVRYAQADVEAWMSANFTRHISSSDPGSPFLPENPEMGSDQ
jgi:predicted DNA-binding transcriptional regulator AlpA